jgi:hypothetical protein
VGGAVMALCCRLRAPGAGAAAGPGAGTGAGASGARPAPCRAIIARSPLRPVTAGGRPGLPGGAAARGLIHVKARHRGRADEETRKQDRQDAAR